MRPRCRLACGNDGQDDMRRARLVVVDRLMGRPQLGVNAPPVSGIRIAVKPRKIRRADIYPDADVLT